MDVVDQLLGVSRRQPSKAPHVLAHGLVVLLNVAGRNIVAIRIAFDAVLYGTIALAGAVLTLRAFRISSFAINLDQHGELMSAPNASSTAPR